MQTALIASLFARERLRHAADLIAVAVAVSLPWSTSATTILIALWFLALLPTLDGTALRRGLLLPAGGLAVALVVLACVGTLWSEGPLAERWGGVRVYVRLLAIPLLLIQF